MADLPSLNYEFRQIDLITDIPSYAFSSGLEEFSFLAYYPGATKDEPASDIDVTFYADGEAIFSEVYVADANLMITLHNLAEIFEPYLEDKRIREFSYKVLAGTSSQKSKSFTVQYCATEVDVSAETFIENYFLTVMRGNKVTAPEWEEYLHLVCSKSTPVVVTAAYDDGSTSETTLTTISTLNDITTVEVSPEKFVVDGKELLSYTVTAGSRAQTYIVARNGIASSPNIVFTNSFGCQEIFYCTGEYQMEAEYDRLFATTASKYKAYSVTEKRNYKANTGALTNDMANWGEDLLRSKELYLFENGALGKEITVTDAKLTRTNAVDELPSFNFEYRYSQRNHNILRTSNAGRIFDTTFDKTFN